MKEYEEKSKSELLFFQIFTDESGTIFSQYQGEGMEKFRWRQYFKDLEDAIYNMKIKIELI